MPLSNRITAMAALSMMSVTLLLAEEPVPETVTEYQADAINIPELLMRQAPVLDTVPNIETDPERLSQISVSLQRTPQESFNFTIPEPPTTPEPLPSVDIRTISFQPDVELEDSGNDVVVYNTREPLYFGWNGTFRHQTGPGIGYEHSFSTLELFAPWVNDTLDQLFFVDVRGILNNEALSGANLGAGLRTYNARNRSVLGVFGYYDYRDVEVEGFHQLSLGFDYLRPEFDLRGNVYWGVGDDLAVSGQMMGPGQKVPVFTGNTLNFQTMGVMQQTGLAALNGFDFEAGIPVPRTSDYVEAFAGVYYYDSPHTDSAWGVRGRAQAIMTEFLALNLTVSNDRLWDTSVMFQVAFSFPGARAHWAGARPAGVDRLDEPVWRRHNIAVTDETRMTGMVGMAMGDPVPAIDPNTGMPRAIAKCWVPISKEPQAASCMIPSTNFFPSKRRIIFSCPLSLRHLLSA